jgi:hypothetical protein
MLFLILRNSKELHVEISQSMTKELSFIVVFYLATDLPKYNFLVFLHYAKRLGQLEKLFSENLIMASYEISLSDSAEDS